MWSTYTSTICCLSRACESLNLARLSTTEHLKSMNACRKVHYYRRTRKRILVYEPIITKKRLVVNLKVSGSPKKLATKMKRYIAKDKVEDI